MPTAKDLVLRIVKEQPDDSTFEELLRELAFARMVERGLGDSEAGRTITSKELKRRMAKWRR